MITVISNGRLYIDGNESNFFIYEFVAPEIYLKWGANSLRYIQESVIRGAQMLRDSSGQSTTINNYKGGGPYKDSGTRTLQSYERMFGREKGLNKYLATYSMHKFGGAADLKIGDMSSHEMAKLVFNIEKGLLEVGIRRIENPDFTKGKNRGWLHIDTGNSGKDHIIQVNP